MDMLTHALDSSAGSTSSVAGPSSRESHPDVARRPLHRKRGSALGWLGFALLAVGVNLQAINIDPNKPIRRLPTAEQIQSALRHGLFAQVTEGGT